MDIQDQRDYERQRNGGLTNEEVVEVWQTLGSAMFTPAEMLTLSTRFVNGKYLRESEAEISKSVRDIVIQLLANRL